MKRNKIIFNLLPLLILLLLVFIYFNRLFFPKLSLFVTPDFGESDLLHGYYPIKYLLSQSLKNNQILLWTNKEAAGQPIFAEGQIGTFSIFNLILFRFLPFLWAINISYIIIFIFAGAGTYFLAQAISINKQFSLLSAVVFTFSGFNICQISHISLLQSASFLPWELLLVEEIVKKNSWKKIFILSFLISQQIFSGHQQITVYSFIGLYLYIFIKDYLNKKKGLILRHFFYLSLAVVGSLFLSAVLLLPSIELFKTSMMGKPVDFPYPPKHLITLIWPFFFGSPKTGNYPLYNNNWGIFWENTGYVGLLPLITFFISFFLIKNKKIIIFLILIFLSIILVLGKYSPIYFIFDLPPLRYFRVASRFLLITDLSLALLTGLVFTELFNHKVLKNKMSWLVFISLLLLQVTNIFYYFYNYHPVGDAKLWLSEPEIVKYLKKDRSQYRIYTIEDNDKWNDIFLNNGWENPEKYLVFKNGLFIHSNFLYDVPKNNIYSRFIRPRVQFFNGLIDEENFSTLSAELLGMKSVKYVITSKNKKLEGIKFLKYFRNYSLYLNPYFKERIAVVYQYKTVETTNQYKNYLLSDEFEPDRQAIVEDDLKINPQCLKTNSCNYRIDKIIDQDSIVKFSVETNDKGILILRDTYDDNWKAEVDGLSVKIFPVNLTQRGILITAGVHQVQFSYKPSSYRIGLIISIVSHILLTIFFLFYLSRLRGTSSL